MVGYIKCLLNNFDQYLSMVLPEFGIIFFQMHHASKDPEYGFISGKTRPHDCKDSLCVPNKPLVLHTWFVIQAFLFIAIDHENSDKCRIDIHLQLEKKAGNSEAKSILDSEHHHLHLI